jgi:hypothetical protein
MTTLNQHQRAERPPYTTGPTGSTRRPFTPFRGKLGLYHFTDETGADFGPYTGKTAAITHARQKRAAWLARKERP